MPLHKADDFEDCSHSRLGTAPRWCTDETGCVVMHVTAESWILITTRTIKNSLLKCGFLIANVSSNDDSAVKLTEVEEDNWHSLRPFGLQSEGYPTCDSVHKDC
jgi:hypothetical protein